MQQCVSTICFNIFRASKHDFLTKNLKNQPNKISDIKDTRVHPFEMVIFAIYGQH